MKHKIARVGFAVVLAFGLMASLAVTASADDGGCSVSRAGGKWGFTDNGTVVGVGPRTAVGLFTLDGHGNVVNASATSSLNGNIAEETFSGTYTVNPDCTGTITVTIYASGAPILNLTANMVFEDSMKEIRALFTSAVLPNGASLATVISIEARRQ